jgi:hypothetical protein
MTTVPRPLEDVFRLPLIAHCALDSRAKSIYLTLAVWAGIGQRIAWFLKGAVCSARGRKKRGGRSCERPPPVFMVTF